MPTYLCVTDEGTFGRVQSPAESSHRELYLMHSEWLVIHLQWYNTNSHIDGQIAGIYADWLEENADYLERVRGDGRCLLLMVEWLRSTFHNPNHNKVSVSS